MTILRCCLLLPLMGTGSFFKNDDMVPVGACGRTADGIECWDMEGRRDPELLRQLDGRVSDRKPSNPSQVVRHAIYRERPPFSDSQELRTVQISVSPTPDTFSYDLTFIAPLAREFEIPFRNGASWSEGPVRFGVGEAFEVIGKRLLSSAVLAEKGIRLSQRLVHPTGVRMWEAVVGVDTPPQQLILGSLVPLDDLGHVIQYVDRKGRPVPPEMAGQMADMFPAPGKEDLSAKVFKATFALPRFHVLSPAEWCDTNIDPGSIRQLRVRMLHAVHTGYQTFPNRPK